MQNEEINFVLHSAFIVLRYTSRSCRRGSGGEIGRDGVLNLVYVGNYEPQLIARQYLQFGSDAIGFGIGHGYHENLAEPANGDRVQTEGGAAIDDRDRLGVDTQRFQIDALHLREQLVAPDLPDMLGGTKAPRQCDLAEAAMRCGLIDQNFIDVQTG
jgi:hypothetical protein